jgi:hypothetical protein
VYACSASFRLDPGPSLYVVFAVACGLFAVFASLANLLFWRAQLAGAGTRRPLSTTLASAVGAALLLPAIAWALGLAAIQIAY